MRDHFGLKSNILTVVIAGNLVDKARQRGIPVMKGAAQAEPHQEAASLRLRGLSHFARTLTSAPAPASVFGVALRGGTVLHGR